MFPEKLFNLISGDHTELAQSFLEQSPLVLDYQFEDYQILRDVLCRGQIQMAEMLINKGFRVNLEPQHHSISSPLHIAAHSGFTTIVELLLTKGASVDVCDERNQSPLHVAAKANQNALADLMLPLVSRGYQTDQDDLSHMHVACLRGNSEVVEKFLKNGHQMGQYEKLNSSVSKNSSKWPGFTPLHFAVYSESIETVRILLNCGADIIIKDASESTPLHLAYSMHNNQIMDLILLSHKYTSGNPSNREKWNHFHIACTRDNPLTAASFLQQRLVPDEKAGLYSPLEIAITYQCKKVIELILNYRIHKFSNYDKMVRVAMNNMSYRDVKDIFCRYKDEAYRPPQIQHLKPISYFQRLCINYVTDHPRQLESLQGRINRGADVNETLPADSAFWPGGTTLHFTAKVGCGDMVRFLIQNGANINAKDARNKTPLHCAFDNDQSGAIDSITSACSDISVNPADNNGFTYFHIFCAKNKYSLVERFLQGGVDVNQQVKNDSTFWPEYTPLHFSVYFNSKETVKILLEHGADTLKKNGLGCTALEMSIMHLGNITGIYEMEATMEIIQLLLQFQSLKVNASGSTKGFSLLQLAYCYSEQDDPSALQEILLDGNINQAIDLDVPKFGGYTALHFAVESGLPNKIKWLLDNGADPSIEDASGNTPLHLWEVHQFNPIDHRLILPKNPTSRLTGKSHFHILCEYADFDTLAHALNEFQFDVNQKIEMNFTSSQASMTGLHLVVNQVYACSQNLQLLVDRGADVNARDLKENTPLHYTGANKLTKDLEILLANGADVNARNIFGKTPMHELCQSKLEDDTSINGGYTWIYNFLVNDDDFKFMTNKLKILLANGADVDIIDGSGHTPFTLRIQQVSWYLADSVIMTEHMKKLEELGLPISEDNDLQLKEERTSTGSIHPCEEKFLALCRSEIKKMEETVIVKPYNLRSFLTEDLNVLAKHAGNIRFRKMVQLDELREEFPLYGYLVRLRFRRGEERKIKLDQTINHLNSIIGLDLPKELSLKILQYLTNDELDNLVIAPIGGSQPVGS